VLVAKARGVEDDFVVTLKALRRLVHYLKPPFEGKVIEVAASRAEIVQFLKSADASEKIPKRLPKRPVVEDQTFVTEKRRQIVKDRIRGMRAHREGDEEKRKKIRKRRRSLESEEKERKRIWERRLRREGRIR
jgi:hypothetical protein